MKVLTNSRCARPNVPVLCVVSCPELGQPTRIGGSPEDETETAVRPSFLRGPALQSWGLMATQAQTDPYLAGVNDEDEEEDEEEEEHVVDEEVGLGELVWPRLSLYAGGACVTARWGTEDTRSVRSHLAEFFCIAAVDRCLGASAEEAKGLGCLFGGGRGSLDR